MRPEDEILKYNSFGRIVFCEDLNARTGAEPDYIVNTKNPLDLASAHLTNTDSTLISLIDAAEIKLSSNLTENDLMIYVRS